MRTAADYSGCDAVDMGGDSELKSGQPILTLGDQGAWDRWLAQHFDGPTGVWVKLARKGAGAATVTYAEAVDAALCYGWIDGQRAAYDDVFWLQRFTRRGPRSRWSQINREKAERLIAEGRMHEPGLAEIRAAQRDGRWEAAYPAQSQASVPADLQAALDQHPSAKEFFETLTGSTRYAFLFRLHNVKRPQNRARRIANYIELLSAGKTLFD